MIEYQGIITKTNHLAIIMDHHDVQDKIEQAKFFKATYNSCEFLGNDNLLIEKITLHEERIKNELQMQKEIFIYVVDHNKNDELKYKVQIQNSAKKIN